MKMKKKWPTEHAVDHLKTNPMTGEKRTNLNRKPLI